MAYKADSIDDLLEAIQTQEDANLAASHTSHS